MIPHYLFLMPRPDSFPLIMPAAQSHILSIFLPNLILMVLHALHPTPTPPPYWSAARGYLHGGVLVDFVGQKPPVYRASLLFLDVVVLVVQCLMLAVHQERERLRSVSGRLESLRRRGGLETGGEDGADAPVRRDDSSESWADGNDGSDVSLYRDRTGDPDRGVLYDMMISGVGFMGDFDPVDTIRNAAMDYETAAAHSLRSLGYATSYMAMAAGRRRAASRPETIPTGPHGQGQPMGERRT